MLRKFSLFLLLTLSATSFANRQSPDFMKEWYKQRSDAFTLHQSLLEECPNTSATDYCEERTKNVIEKLRHYREFVQQTAVTNLNYKSSIFMTPIAYLLGGLLVLKLMNGNEARHLQQMNMMALAAIIYKGLEEFFTPQLNLWPVIENPTTELEKELSLVVITEKNFRLVDYRKT